MVASEPGATTALDLQVEAATRRYDASRDVRESVRVALESGAGVSDTEEQLQARALRLVEQGETPLATVVELALAHDVPDRKAALERIIGETNDLQSSSFLPRGVRAASSVARISLRENGRERPLGTGFLVSPRLLMTNEHVLPDAREAKQVVVEFGAEVDTDHVPVAPRRYLLDPDAFFVADQTLDMALVAVQPDADGRPPGDHVRWNQLIRQQGKIVTGEHVNVVGHPQGRLKEIAIRDNRLDNQLDHFLQYSTDTEPGNSGSPVFNDQWEVVALHHAGVMRRDAQGRVLRQDGQVWKQGDGDHAIAWAGNEGARVSVILTFLAGLDLDPAGRELLAELGPAAGLDVTPEVSPAAVAPAAALLPTPRAQERNGRPGRGVRGRDGEPHLVFLHGRSQQGQDPERLRSTWTAGLNAGLTRAGLPGVEPGSAWLPFYGDRLVDVVATTESVGGVPPASDPALVVYEELLAAAAAGTGMPAEDATADGSAAPDGGDEGIAGVGASVVQRLQRQLSWVAARSGLDDAAIALFFRDVAAYLGRPGVRDAVLEEVAGGLPERGPVVLVSHSLGTVVALDLVSRLEHLDVPLLVTAGSPLGMDAVRSRLLERGRPARVRHWANAWSPADAVAIGCPLRRTWGTDVQEIVTDNTKDRAHDITEYLGSAAVSRVIGSVLSARAPAQV